MFHVGQQVVCIDGSNWPTCIFKGYSPVLPQEGETYQIFAILDGRAEGWPEDGVLLLEIRNPGGSRRDGTPSDRIVFRASRFRPLRATSIDVFTGMLEPVPAREKELVDA